jgi:hypothetical protein
MMRLLMIFIFTVLGIGKLSAQNLQYGKAKLIDSKVDTVPAGRAWKLEGFVFTNSIANCPSSSTEVNITDSILLNGNNFAVRAQRFFGPTYTSRGSTAPTYLIWKQETPLWLPAGTTLAAGRGVSYINIIEFKESP